MPTLAVSPWGQVYIPVRRASRNAPTAFGCSRGRSNGWVGEEQEMRCIQPEVRQHRHLDSLRAVKHDRIARSRYRGKACISPTAGDVCDPKQACATADCGEGRAASASEMSRNFGLDKS